MKELELYQEKIFEDIKHIDEYGNEYWFARELQKVLEYKKWQKFINVKENTKLACEQNKFIIDDHFTQVGKTSKMPNSRVKNIKMSLLFNNTSFGY